MIIFSGNTNSDDCEIFPIVKLNKILLDKNTEKQLYYKLLKSKITTQNVLISHQLTKTYKLPSLFKSTFSYIERYFTAVVQDGSFLELEHSLVSKILSSSELFITSELEVYNAADSWVGHWLDVWVLNALIVLKLLF